MFFVEVTFEEVKRLSLGVQFLRYDSIARRFTVRSCSGSLRAVFDAGDQFRYFLFPKEFLNGELE